MLFCVLSLPKGKTATTEGGADDSSCDSEEIEKRAKGQVRKQSSSSLSETQDRVRRLSGHQTQDDQFTRQCETALVELEMDGDAIGRRASLSKRRSSRARFANKVFGRLYSRRAYTDGLLFGSGHFLGDVSKMVAGLISSDVESVVGRDGDDGSSVPAYGFGESRSVSKYEHGVVGEEHQLVHSSTLAAGKEGCVVLVFPKAALIPFLDEYPGLLLSLLGTQVVV